MSLDSWKKEFYPVEASEIAFNGSVSDCIKHSLVKWYGLRKENLEKHGVKYTSDEFALSDKSAPVYSIATQTLEIDSASCALCQKYDTNCILCVLAESNGGACDEAANGREAVYNAFVDANDPDNPDPEPMIAALEKCLAEYKEE